MSLFAGTAAYYARYRPGYPPELLERLAEAAGLDGTGRLLDLGCGPGPLAVPLAPRFEEVVAVDVEPEMLAQLPPGIRTVLGRAEDGDESWGAFRLVTIGRAFHWMDGPVVMERLARITRQVALVGDSHEDSEAQTASRADRHHIVVPSNDVVPSRPRPPRRRVTRAVCAARAARCALLRAPARRTAG
jgi:SAM-dependent methyltransferase